MESIKPYKVFIVDDEYMIVKGLEKLIPWEELGLELVGTASTGQEAYICLMNLDVDIVITDVNMPKLNGIDFVTRARMLNKQFECIFISGYQEFEYIKKAMDLGATNYLLKPIDKKELRIALEKVCSKLDGNKVLLQSQNEKKLLLTQWLTSINNDTGMGQVDYLEYDSFEICHVVYYINNQAQLDVLVNKLSKYPNSVIFYAKANFVGAIIIESNELLDDSLIIYKRKSEVTNFSNFKEIQKLYYNLLHNYVFYHQDESLNIENWMQSVRNTFVHQDYTEWFNEQQSIMMDMMSKESVKFILNEITQILQEARTQCIPSVDLIALIISIIYYDSFNQMNVNINVLNQTLETLNNVESLQQLVDGIEYYFDQVKQSKHVIINDFVKQTLQIIHQQYKQDISLKSISEELHINVMYLGQLFKKEIGETFSKYLTEYRLTIAANLLLKTSDSISEIAHQVGYQSQAYFYRLFKEKYNQSPKEYRKNMIY